MQLQSHKSPTVYGLTHSMSHVLQPNTPIKKLLLVRSDIDSVPLVGLPPDQVEEPAAQSPAHEEKHIHLSQCKANGKSNCICGVAANEEYDTALQILQPGGMYMLRYETQNSDTLAGYSKRTCLVLRAGIVGETPFARKNGHGDDQTSGFWVLDFCLLEGKLVALKKFFKEFSILTIDSAKLLKPELDLLQEMHQSRTPLPSAMQIFEKLMHPVCTDDLKDFSSFIEIAIAQAVTDLVNFEVNDLGPNNEVHPYGLAKKDAGGKRPTAKKTIKKKTFVKE